MQHILYALHLQAANYPTRRVNEVGVWIKIPQNKCKVNSAAFVALCWDSSVLCASGDIEKPVLHFHKQASH